MRYIDLSKIDTLSPEFLDWKRTANRCFTELQGKATHEERSKYFTDHPIWSDLKSLLMKIYGSKCWYSECDLTGFPGDIDHFRPKNKSLSEDGTTILPDGYWWLAYNYLNYRLSCENCNRPFKDAGKGNYFPLKSGSIPASVGNDNDIPLLLDPCNQDDVNVIDCNDTGRIIALSSDPVQKQRVAISNRIYNWNLFDMARKRIRSSCQVKLEQFETDYEQNPDGLRLDLFNLKELTDDTTPYSSFAKRYIRFKIEGKPYEGTLTDALKLNEL